MQKRKENLFLDKFRLLNSQEHIEEIVWSLSDSSDHEESAVNGKFNNITNKSRSLKRKRKKKAPKDIPNLTITVFDTSKDSKDCQSGESSPILVSKSYKKSQKSLYKSPTLAPNQTSRQNTPVLPSRSSHQKSPILALKYDSPKSAGKVKKNLFSHQKFENDLPNTSSYHINDNIQVKTEIDSDYDIEDGNLTSRSTISDLLDRVKEENTPIAKLELVKKVRSFFDSQFSSESSSQQNLSISETHTQNNSTKSSDDIEILISKSPLPSNSNTYTIKPATDQSDPENACNTLHKMKKVRYKKDGLAYRLNNLLRKQNTCLSLWHHERFLAKTTNFIIPKEENIVFRIQKVHLKYGCCLIEAVDLNEDKFLVLINCCYVSDTILCDTVIKVYKPFNIVQYNTDTKLLINVCRYECSQYIIKHKLE